MTLGALAAVGFGVWLLVVSARLLRGDGPVRWPVCHGGATSAHEWMHETATLPDGRVEWRLRCLGCGRRSVGLRLERPVRPS